ncbi:hypothetical protein [Undibacterium sp. TC9W]|uniref:hypothetical protein n=1 Tax=Undibacterium sp. TC9W TaxID=3413053 RepID=UPI003BF0F91E
MTPFKFTVTNNGPDDLVVCIEPWAHDFTLEAGDDIQIICDSAETELDMYREDGFVQIYLNSSSGFIVQQQGAVIHCGHKRKVGLPH